MSMIWHFQEILSSICLINSYFFNCFTKCYDDFLNDFKNSQYYSNAFKKSIFFVLEITKSFNIKLHKFIIIIMNDLHLSLKFLVSMSVTHFSNCPTQIALSQHRLSHLHFSMLIRQHFYTFIYKSWFKTVVN